MASTRGDPRREASTRRASPIATEPPPTATRGTVDPLQIRAGASAGWSIRSSATRAPERTATTITLVADQTRRAGPGRATAVAAVVVLGITCSTVGAAGSTQARPVFETATRPGTAGTAVAVVVAVPRSLGSTRRSCWRPPGPIWTKDAVPASHVAAIVTGASARPSLSRTVSMPFASQQWITGGATPEVRGTITKPPSPVGARMPAPMAATLVRTETGTSGAPVRKRRDDRSSDARKTSAR